MRFIAMSNPGSLDVVSCVNMLGASVKENANAIGMFGSGIKFALAQALRMGIPVQISDGENMFTTTVVNRAFRNKSFEMVGLVKNDNEETVVTPLTSEFGAKDWNDKWFIFREFWSNMLDESGNATIVDSQEHTSGHTTVFLPYDDFSEYYENISDYFRPYECDNVKVGTGRVFRQGVYVGSMDINLDMDCHNVKLNECRVADTRSIEQAMNGLVEWSKCPDVWSVVLNPEVSTKLDVYVGKFHPTEVHNAIINGLEKAVGDKYCVCPNVIEIIKDVQAMGFTPVPLKNGDMFHFDGLRTYMSLITKSSIRDMDNEETDKYIKVLTKISSFIPLKDTQDIIVKVITTDNASVMGEADIKNRTIHLRESIFKDEYKLTHFVIHEIGHILSRADDYSRQFIDFFVNRLTDVAMK